MTTISQTSTDTLRAATVSLADSMLQAARDHAPYEEIKTALIASATELKTRPRCASCADARDLDELKLCQTCRDTFDADMRRA